MATLKELVNETTNIKTDLIKCHSDLKAALNSKGVVINESDKLGVLIEKVNTIPSYKKIAGTEKTYLSDDNRYTTNSTTFQNIKEYTINDNFESFRVSYSTNQTSYATHIKMDHVRSGVVLSTRTDGSAKNVKQDLTDIRVGDKIIMYGKTGSSANAAYTSFTINYSIELI